MAPVRGNPGAATPPPPLVISAGRGCPHEKQTEGCPGVAMVFMPQAGQRTWMTGGGPDGAPKAGDCPAGAGAAAGSRGVDNGVGGGAAGGENIGWGGACCAYNAGAASWGEYAARPPGAAAVAAKGSAACCIPYPPGGGAPYPPPGGGGAPYPGGGCWAGGGAPPPRLRFPPPPRIRTMTSSTMTIARPAMPAMSGHDSGFLVALSVRTVLASSDDARLALLS